jgi:hypothetical protein
MCHRPAGLMASANRGEYLADDRRVRRPPREVHR